MEKPNWGVGALVGGLLTLPLVALFYLANQLADLPFVPFDLFDWVTRILPGPLVTLGIDSMITLLTAVGMDVADTAKTAERLSALIQFLAVGILFGALFFAVLRRRHGSGDRLAGILAGVLLGMPLAGISLAITQTSATPLLSFAWIVLLCLAWGGALNWSHGRLAASSRPAHGDDEVRAVARLNRRQFLVRLGASTATITVAGGGLAAVLAAAEQRRLQAALDDSMAHQVEENSLAAFPNADDPVVPVPGTRPEYTPVKDHYKVFIRTEPTEIDGASWVLPITGLVANPLMLTLDELRNNFLQRDQYVTLSCISGRIGTTLISTTQWTGVSVQEILAEAGVAPEARYLVIESGDGFYETVPLELIQADDRIMFCHSWDGNNLPVDHGYPLRIWIPDRFGMKQPKWITNVIVTDAYQEGYWVERGWDEVAQVQTTSVIDTVAVNHLVEDGDQRLIPVGGIAWAGDRQISQVEVRVDGGPWQPAALRAPLSETTWVLWRFEWPYTPGDHLFEVRCAEGDGTPQIETERPSRPSGATGIHSRESNVPVA